MYSVGYILQKKMRDNPDIRNPELYKITTIYPEKNHYILTDMQTGEQSQYARENLDVFFTKYHQ